MNYYERIQKSIDYIESNLENAIDIEKAASEAYMSSSNYYRMFFALTGHAVKEYIRQRRISIAVNCIKEGDSNILDIALKYGFESNEAFTRACRRVTGYPPSAFRKGNLNYTFERVNILDKYFDIQDKGLLEKYPEIKVLKEVEPMRVAYYCFYGKEPENGAFGVMAQWLRKGSLNYEKDKLRIFGYNNPSPKAGEEEYGYEVCVTIPEGFEFSDDKVKTKMFNGGLYTVCGVRKGAAGDIGCDIVNAWKRLVKWLEDSKYQLGEHQWFEDHLQFDDEFQHVAGVDLYMPIKLK